jgi:hypothetical protein
MKLFRAVHPTRSADRAMLQRTMTPRGAL